jgi:uncharacterized protein (DUF1778 family)
MPKVGRPKLPQNQVRTVFQVRLSKDERKIIGAAAKAAGEKTSLWARNQLLKAAK